MEVGWEKVGQIFTEHVWSVFFPWSSCSRENPVALSQKLAGYSGHLATESYCSLWIILKSVILMWINHPTRTLMFLAFGPAIPTARWRDGLIFRRHKSARAKTPGQLMHFNDISAFLQEWLPARSNGHWFMGHTELLLYHAKNGIFSRPDLNVQPNCEAAVN